MNQENKDRILEIMNQVKEGLETPESASELMIKAIDLAFESGKNDFSIEDLQVDELLDAIEKSNELMWFSEEQNKRLEDIVIANQGDTELTAHNLHDEQKLELFKNAFKKYTLRELEIKLA